MAKKVHNPHDAFFKAILGRPARAAAFLRAYLPVVIAQLLDLTQVKLEKDSFVDAKLRQHFSDLLYRVQLKDGGAAYVFLLLEHKSEPDGWVGLQLLRYLALAWEQMRRRGAERLPLIIPVVFYHGATPWRLATNFSALLAPADTARSLRRFVPDFEHYLFDLSQYSDEELIGEGVLPAALRLLKHIFRPDLKEQLPGIFQQVADAPLEEAAESLRLMVEYVTQAERASEEEIGAALELAEGEPMESVIDKWRKQWTQAGKQEGKQLGAAELTLNMLQHKFGVLDNATQTRINSLSLAQLERLSIALLDFQGPEDLAKWLRRVRPASAAKNGAAKDLPLSKIGSKRS